MHRWQPRCACPGLAEPCSGAEVRSKTGSRAQAGGRVPVFEEAAGPALLQPKPAVERGREAIASRAERAAIAALARCLLSAAAVRVAAVSTRYAASSFGPRTAQVDDRPPPSLTEATDQAHGPPGALDAFGDLADAPRLTITPPNVTRRHRLVHDATGDLAADAASGATLFDTITQLAKSADARAQKTKQAVVEAAVEIARKPVEVLRVGVPVIAARAREATDAFSQGMGESIQLLEEGDVAGALKAATIAIARLQKASHISDEGTSAAVSRSVGFLMVFVLLGLAWGLEFLLSRKSVPEQEADPAEKGNMRQKPFFHALRCPLALPPDLYTYTSRRLQHLGLCLVTDHVLVSPCVRAAPAQNC
ncbi:unnamed protein product [Prorocentrum cordatum]|uniref:Uncharacterized protein n=1 Tax=Prorocentrum cordatum TaxID=2364126 RepID=A0ABN9XVP6_9DINO|nr:unnamed protein product [Polarella glacialis]